MSDVAPPLLQVFYDGACPLCSREMNHYRKLDTEHRIAWVDIARPDFDARALGLDPVRLQQVMHARTPEGKVFTEVAAFVKIWETLPPRFWTRVARFVLKVPGMMAVAGILYRLFARNRYRLTGRCPPEGCAIGESK